MRAAYEVANQSGWDVYIGAHTIANPAEFVAQVRDLDKSAGSGKSCLQARTACMHDRGCPGAPQVVRQGQGEGGLTITQGSAVAMV